MIPVFPRVLQPGCRLGPFLILGLLSCCGCDLGDYEKRVDEERSWVSYFDSENKMLGDAVSLPRKKDTVIVTNKAGKPEKKLEPNPLLKIDVFLRPPKQFASRLSKDDENNPFANLLYRYVGRGNFQLLIGATQEKKKTPAAFQEEVRLALAQYYLKEYKRPVVFPPTKTKPDQRKPFQTRFDKPLPIVFQTVTYTDGLDQGRSFQVFLYKSGIDQIAIVLESPTAEVASLTSAIDYSLKTLTTHAAAAAKRREYLSRAG
jgi:hypothetical protein